MEIIGSGLEGQEYVTVLSWVIQTYPGKELMADLSLGIPQSKVKPLLDADTVIRLQARIYPSLLSINIATLDVQFRAIRCLSRAVPLNPTALKREFLKLSANPKGSNKTGNTNIH